MRLPQRHDLLRPTREGWEALFADRPALGEIEELRDWARAGHPVVATRRDRSVPEGFWPVAVRLPPSVGGSRLGFSIRSELVASVEAAPSLALASGQAGAVVPGMLRVAIGRVLEGAPMIPSMFGSVMWSCVSGRAFATERSDLDLLWPVGSGEVEALLAWLARSDAAGPPRLDGEILLSGAGGTAGVQWRELLSAIASGGDVLVKRCDGVYLADARRLVAGAA